MRSYFKNYYDICRTISNFPILGYYEIEQSDFSHIINFVHIYLNNNIKVLNYND